MPITVMVTATVAIPTTLPPVAMIIVLALPSVSIHNCNLQAHGLSGWIRSTAGNCLSAVVSPRVFSSTATVATTPSFAEVDAQHPCDPQPLHGLGINQRNFT